METLKFGLAKELNKKYAFYFCNFSRSQVWTKSRQDQKVKVKKIFFEDLFLVFIS